METHRILSHSHTVVRHWSLGPPNLLWDRAAGLDWMPGPTGVGRTWRCPCDLCFLPSRFMPSFLRLGSWNVVMFVTYEQLKRALMASCTSREAPF